MKIAVFSATLLLRSAIKNDIIIMTSRQKRLQKLVNSQELFFNDMKTILSDFGYQLVRITGSHHIFKNIAEDRINLPVHNGKIKKKYVKMVCTKIFKLINHEKM